MLTSRGEVVIPEGADTTYFRKNGSILVDHDDSIRNVVRKTQKLPTVPILKEPERLAREGSHIQYRTPETTLSP